ncbi:aminomethyl-transferring glycine dehydrogenase [Lewinella cohaerens]|uniref:aminomethyl-transferring glycine dehydrogenase n=1 Tax=Lewinella cohaerens TaxID=70995 RepID=UPI00037FFBC5|nr:aminomethyl-transferring glycine dehydrogenase [Lewinella cohaerens]
MSKTAFFDQFVNRHIGPSPAEVSQMIKTIGVKSLDQLIDETVPADIRRKDAIKVPVAQTEHAYLGSLKALAAKNKVYKTYIGLGYYPTITPSVIARNIFQNPGWYTQYTPYQAEIAQGRLEALLNFQTMVSDLTGMEIANASLLDEGTAAAEAMALFFAQKNKRNKKEPINVFLVADQVLPQTIAVLQARAEPLGVEVQVKPVGDFELNDQVFGLMLQYPAANGAVEDYRALTAEANAKNIYVTVAADLMALTVLMPPGEWGADAVVGNTQRFGVPMGYGGPHAAYFACREAYKRSLPGRIIGVSVDQRGKPALRMALQTREQHIRREKATSNICTAQALLAIMAGMYAAWHGPEGLRAIAVRINTLAQLLGQSAKQLGYELEVEHYFDTVTIKADNQSRLAIRRAALGAELNFHYTDTGVQISLDETTTREDVEQIAGILAVDFEQDTIALATEEPATISAPESLYRQTDYLTHPVFNSYQTETEMMRYIKRLENRDLSLTHSMIALGSCTMKLNAATELMPVSWPEFANLHPFVPKDQAAGYYQMFTELEAWLSDITGFTACSLQPNSGAQGEYTGLLTIRAYHLSRGDDNRNVAIIPDSAHGTNPASAVMAGMKVVVVKCDDEGNIDIADLREKAEANAADLSCLMVTYPSTHGVFETGIKEICQIIHEFGGLVYMDGANMNAQVGLTSPGLIKADVCHLNLHKTFAIPHGGGGPGMGPICVNDKLAPFLPKHPLVETGGEQGILPVSAAPWGSASILLISYAYIKMLGPDGLTDASRYAILNANYIKARLEEHYSVLFKGENGHTAHELIIDLRPFKELISAADVAKRLIDYSFHAPTLSWPVAGTIMIEPTESESMAELDRFCDAMIAIRKEIDEIASGEADAENNVLHNAPHVLEWLTADEWPFPYSRQKAAWPLPYLLEGRKFWASVARVDNGFGDRNLVCTCPPIESYAE